MKSFRTDRRRNVTRTSGFSVSGDFTGGESLVLNSDLTKVKLLDKLSFSRKNINLYELFQSEFGILAFGGYVKSNENIIIKLNLSGQQEGKRYFQLEKKINIPKNEWTQIGLHINLSLSNKNIASNIPDNSNDIILEVIPFANCSITILPVDNEDTSLNKSNADSNSNIDLQCMCFDFDSVNLDYFKSQESLKYFKTKTSLYIPGIYYLNTLLPIEKYLSSNNYFSKGEPIVLKSCNRCSRLLPIDPFNNNNSLEFSRHCVKRAPCIHSNFNNFSIINIEDLNNIINDLEFIKNNKVNTIYGHQLECRSCKKFFVNAPLNPQRTPQQHKEDSLRRRSFEVLINNLFDTNLIHFEFENDIGLNQFIWEKFDKKCFKCKKQIPINEMHLDHTMPLAYLYRLDETATCLCAEHNLQKSDKFPVDFYSKEELNELIEITGLDPSIAKSRTVNKKVVDELSKQIDWFFDVFLMYKDYYRIIDNKLVSRSIYSNLNKVLRNSGYKDNYLLDLYKSKFNKYPESIKKQKKK